MNKKAISFSDIVFFSVGVLFIAIALIYFYSTIDNSQKEKYDELNIQKEGYQTTQLARTFVQSPLEFKGETRSVARWVDFYFDEASLSQQVELRSALKTFADKTLVLHLQDREKDSVAAFTYYYLDRKMGELVVAHTFGKNIKDEQENNLVYSDSSQEDILLKLPMMVEGDEYTPSDHYITFEIRLAKETTTKRGNSLI